MKISSTIITYTTMLSFLSSTMAVDAETRKCIHPGNTGDFIDAQPTLKNGDFEDHAACPTSERCHSSDVRLISPWVITSLHKIFELDTPSSWRAKSGSWSMDLSSTQAYSIGQCLETLPQATYRVSYWIQANPYCGPGFKTGKVSVSEGLTGNPLEAGRFSVHTSQIWKKETFVFNATSQQTLLEFKADQGTSCGPVIDAISIEKQILVVSSTTTIMVATTTEQPVDPTQTQVKTTVLETSNVEPVVFTTTEQPIVNTHSTQTIKTTVLATSNVEPAVVTKTEKPVGDVYYF